jgi:hypothetical protein
VLEQTISSVRELEQSIEGRALADLRVRLALRGCLSELRGLISPEESRYANTPATGRCADILQIGR